MNLARRVAAVSLLLLASPVAAEDWARWRGPHQDGGIAAPGTFGERPFGLEVAWSRPLGIAYSGIAVAGDAAVTMFADGTTDWLTAIDLETGAERWRYEIDAMFPSIGGSEGGPVSMPVVDGDVVYGLGAKGHLFAVRLADGAELWSLRIDEKLGARAPHFGFTTTPLVVDRALFVQTGGDAGRSLTAFDKATGEVLWSTGDDEVAYQSPLLLELAGTRQIVAVTDAAVLGLAPATGDVLWRHEHGMTPEGDGSATPVPLGDDRFLLTAQNDSRAFRLSRADGGFELEETWVTTDLKRSLATPVLHDGRLYGFDGDFLTCVDAASGERVWKSRPPGGRGLILVDGHLVIFANDGALVVAAASPEGYVEKARVPVSEAGSYTYPSFAGGRILVRNTRDVASVRVGAPPPVAPAAAATAQPRHAMERFVRLVAGAEDKRLLVDDFMAAQRGFPIVEDDRWVHFVHRGAAEDVAITGSMTEFRVEEPLEAIEGTDLRYRSFEIEPGARWEYRLNVDFDEPRPDPLNPRRVGADDGDLSEVATSGWQAPAHLRPYGGTSPGRVERFTLESEILGNAREVVVWLPADYEASGRRYPVLVLNDGNDWLRHAHLPNSLNHLVGRTVAPLLAVFVEMPQAAARDEAGGPKSGDHVRMLATELVPEIDRRYRTLATAESRAVMGVGGGALLATWAAAAHPAVFGKAAGLSVWLPEPAATGLLQAIEAGDGKETRYWLAWNRYELRRAEWDVDLARDTRRVAEALEGRGFAVTRREATDGSGWGGWRVRAGEALEALFGSGGALKSAR